MSKEDQTGKRKNFKADERFKRALLAKIKKIKIEFLTHYEYIHAEDNPRKKRTKAGMIKEKRELEKEFLISMELAARGSASVNPAFKKHCEGQGVDLKDAATRNILQQEVEKMMAIHR